MIDRDQPPLHGLDPAQHLHDLVITERVPRQCSELVDDRVEPVQNLAAHTYDSISNGHLDQENSHK